MLLLVSVNPAMRKYQMQTIQEKVTQYGDMLDAQMKRKMKAQKEIKKLAAELLKRLNGGA
jgi:hypothetical protein